MAIASLNRIFEGFFPNNCSIFIQGLTVTKNEIQRENLYLGIIIEEI